MLNMADSQIPLLCYCILTTTTGQQGHPPNFGQFIRNQLKFEQCMADFTQYFLFFYSCKLNGDVGEKKCICVCGGLP